MGWFPILSLRSLHRQFDDADHESPRAAVFASPLSLGLDRVPDTFVPDGGRDRIVDGRDRHARVYRVKRRYRKSPSTRLPGTRLIPGARPMP